jgi:hypothetical protein
MGIQVRSTGPKVTFWGQNLKILNPTLFANVSKQSGNSLDGHVTIFTNTLDPDIREQLMESLVLLGKMPAPGSMAEHEAMNKAIMDDVDRQGKVIADKNAAIARLDEYEKIQGLVPSDQNTQLITQYIEQHLRGYWSVATVDEAVRYYTRHGRLQFQKNAPPATPAAPAETLVKLSDGSLQLPLDKPVPRNATVTQAKDYLGARPRIHLQFQ